MNSSFSYFRGVVLSPAVIPIALTVTWSGLTRAGVFTGCISGAVLGMLAWMIGCLKIYGTSLCCDIMPNLQKINEIGTFGRGDQRPESGRAILRGELVSESTKRDTEKALTRRLVGLRSRPLYPSRRPRPQVRPAQRSFGRQRAGSGKLGTLAAGEA